MNNRVPKISSMLKRWCAEQSGRTCEAMFTDFMKSVLTKTEAKRFFDAYADEPILKFYSKRMCTITVHQDHFNVDAVAEIANLINLKEKIDPRFGKPKVKEAEVPVMVTDLVYNEKTGDFEAPTTPVEYKVRSLGEILSDLDVIIHELDAMGMYLVADKDGYGIRHDYNPVI